MKVYYTNRYLSSYKKLPVDIKLKAEQKEEIFRKNPFDPKIDTHKLGGKLRGYWAFSITKIYRIEFEFLGKKEVLFLRAGTHNIYRRR